MRKVFLAVAILGIAASAQASVVINSIGDTYNQDFNGLGNVDGASYTYVDNSTIAGWYVNSEEMDTNSDEYYAKDGTSTGGEVYSFGDDGASDRALGYLGSGGNDYFNMAISFSNSTGSSIASIAVSFVGEQWRSGGDTSDNNNELVFSYRVFDSGTATLPASTDQTGWTTVSSLLFQPPQPLASVGSLDGNLAANRESLSDTLTGINWGADQELWIRFSGGDGSGSDAGLGIDDFSMQVIPEPTTAGLLLVSGILMTLARRRKK